MALCSSCGDRLADHLGCVGDLYIELGMTAARWDDLSVLLARGGDCGLPYAEAATTASAALVATVGFWAQRIAVLHASLWDVPATLAEVAHWLAMRLDWLRAMTDAGEAYSQIDRAVVRARVVIDRPAHRTSFRVGPCIEVRDSRYCLGDVFAHVPVRVGIEPAVLRCKTLECRRHREPWTTETWYEVGRKMLRLQSQLGIRRRSA